MDDSLEYTNEILELNEYLSEGNVEKLVRLHEDLEEDCVDFIQQMEELLFDLI